MAINYEKISRELKGKCVNCAMDNLFEDFYASPFGQALLENYGEQYFENKELFEQMYPSWIDMMDKFILFGKTQEGERVIDVILRKARLNADMKFTLQNWRDKAFWSVFEIKAINQYWLRTFDVIAEVSYNLHSNDLNRSIQKILGDYGIGDFLLASIAPVGGKWFMSGSQQLFDKNQEQDIFERYIKNISSIKAIYRNNPAKLEKAFKLQEIQYDKFVKYFGDNILTDSGQKLEDKINKFYMDQISEKTRKINFVDLPKEVRETQSVSAVMHLRQGLHFFDDYDSFVKIFSNLEKPKGWNELISEYLEDDQIPAFVFEEMKEKYASNFRLIMNDIIAGFAVKNKFDPVADFEIIMDEFKPNWRNEYPSTHSLNERFRKYYYLDQKVGRNDPCPCGSNKKYKRCCGI